MRNLEPADRLELIGVVWDSLSPTDLQLSDGERDLLDAGLADMESNANDESSWANVKKRLEKLP
ncbi:MAG: addiction module protein [Acidobacteria bacterium]|nr:addiction module protein [Acidobacteriota bacterium]